MTSPSALPPDNPLPEVAPRLRELRRRGGLTLEAAAVRARALARAPVAAGDRSAPAVTAQLLAVARTYGTTVSDLLGETPPVTGVHIIVAFFFGIFYLAGAK
jgi:hypothetical protein